MDSARKTESPPPEQFLGPRRATWAATDGGERRRAGGGGRQRSETAEEEESLPLEDRLQAVMKDLGVHVGEPQSIVRKDPTPREADRNPRDGQRAGVTPKLAMGEAAEGKKIAEVGGGAQGRLVDVEGEAAGDAKGDAPAARRNTVREGGRLVGPAVLTFTGLSVKELK